MEVAPHDAKATATRMRGRKPLYATFTITRMDASLEPRNDESGVSESYDM